MTSNLPKLDRSAFVVSTLHEPSDEKSYWLSKSPYARLEAIEQIRQLVYGYDPATTRFQRILEIAERA